MICCSFMWAMVNYPARCINALLIWVLGCHLTSLHMLYWHAWLPMFVVWWYLFISPNFGVLSSYCKDYISHGARWVLAAASSLLYFKFLINLFLHIKYFPKYDLMSLLYAKFLSPLLEYLMLIESNISSCKYFIYGHFTDNSASNLWTIIRSCSWRLYPCDWGCSCL